MKRCDPRGASPSPNLQREKLVTAVVFIKASGGEWQAALKELAMPR